jgi:hypothetical protein
VAVSIDDRSKIQLMLDRVVREYEGARPTSPSVRSGAPRIDRTACPIPTARAGRTHSLVIDRTGQVRWKFTEVNYKIRPTNEMILAEVNKLRP